MNLMQEYLTRKLSAADLGNELQQLIVRYNDLRKTYLIIYNTSTSKAMRECQAVQEDYYLIDNLISAHVGAPCIDVYLETRGGSGEAVEEIARLLHRMSPCVSFVISGEAKSAGTILALSGDEILMTETASLGPIDAQVPIGRTQISAHDYMEWVKEKRDEAQRTGSLNPFDAVMIAQITPGELGAVNNALEYAKDLVIGWLVKYKFKNWATTETRGEAVTDTFKMARAREIADLLTNHTRWRTHGRSLKIEDLRNDIKLKIQRVDDDPTLSELVYRIQTVCRMLFDSTTVYKIFATADERIFKMAAPPAKSIAIPTQQGSPDVVEVEQTCPKCGKMYRLYAKLAQIPQIDVDFKKKGCIVFPPDNKIKCDCGFEIDMSGTRNQIEMTTKRKILS